MISKLLSVFSGRPNRKFLKSCKPIVAKINQIEQEYQELSEEALKAKTQAFKERLAQGEALNDLLPEAFAAVKNAARRLSGRKITVCEQELTWNMVHYDVQLIGGIALHRDNVAEMATGEGKTLSATLPLYLNALSGKNCQLVTVNDYLARRDSQWMGYLFNYLGVSVGCIQSNMRPEDRQAAYRSDITYGTASEFGFDYLRDNGMATRKEDQVQRDHYFCIVDEADSVLIDEARTPLIISGPAEEQREAPFLKFKPTIQRLVHQQRKQADNFIREAKELLNQDNQKDALERILLVKSAFPKHPELLQLFEQGALRKAYERYELELSSDFNKDQLLRIREELFFNIDERQKQADLTEKGRNTLSPDNPDGFVLPDLPTYFSEIDKDASLTPDAKLNAKRKAEHEFATVSEEIHCISQLLRAYCLYEKDIEYVVQENKVVIVDENTGRAMPGRRWSEGLHQAIEAKEGLAIERETKTYATITIQNYFRMYDKLAGMTGTAETEAQELFDIYGLNVVTIPTHRECIREDLNDVIYKTRREKYDAVVRDIKGAHTSGQPVLAGTTSVEASEYLSKLLKKQNITHSVLNAKHHEQEAEIVARAGQKKAVTIATNMAGRGTDIKLGDGVHDLGGLMVLGTERHESRRIDRQLRGRCSRQGDPGASRFYVSLEDDLMRLFANAGPISKVLEKTFEEGDELEHPMLNRSIQTAQKKVEQQNYSIRKRLLQFDDVLNRQREVIYGIRNEAIHSGEPRTIIFEMIREELEERLESFMTPPKGSSAEHELTQFIHWINTQFPINFVKDDLASTKPEVILDTVIEKIQHAYKEKEQLEEAEDLLSLERYIIIATIDGRWQNHLTEMEELRRSVGLRGYGQKDPLNEYKSEAFVYFEQLMQSIREGICIGLFRSATNITKFQHMLARLSASAKANGPGNSPANQAQEKPKQLPQIKAKRVEPKVGRNDPCPCGSGKKFKKCCGVE